MDALADIRKKPAEKGGPIYKEVKKVVPAVIDNKVGKKIEES